MKSLNIVGCGRAGRTLARVFAQAHAFRVQDLFDVNAATARACARFADAGRPVGRLAGMRPAPVWLLATPDDGIAGAADSLVDAGLLHPGNVIAHLSGATPSLAMTAAIECGAHAGSFHPLKTFADPALAAASFPGTHVALEGDKKALKVLRAALRKAGAHVFEIEPRHKVLYHAGSVMVCNYLTAVLEAGVRCYAGAGIPLETAYRIMQPLVRETVDNVFRVGTVRALTGPVARGDDALVAHQLAELKSLDRNLAAVYRELGLIALDLARSQGSAEPRQLAKVARTLRGQARVV